MLALTNSICMLVWSRSDQHVLDLLLGDKLIVLRCCVLEVDAS